MLPKMNFEVGVLFGAKHTCLMVYEPKESYGYLLILSYSGYSADDPQQTCQIEGLSQVRSGLDLFAAGSELQNSAGICSCRITEFVSAIAE